MNEIEALLSDFREMDATLEVLKMTLNWIHPEDQDVMYDYRKDNILGVYKFHEYLAKNETRVFPQLIRMDWWKVEAEVSWDFVEWTSHAVNADEFCAANQKFFAQAAADVAKIAEFVKRHPEAQWIWAKKKEVEGDER